MNAVKTGVFISQASQDQYDVRELIKNLTSCAVTVVSHWAIVKMAVNMKAWNSGNRFMKINLNTR